MAGPQPVRAAAAGRAGGAGAGDAGDGARRSAVGGAARGDVLVVDVAGKVRRPGIVVLDPGARVVDALEEAGGARRGVDLAPLNLARLLVDGEQIVVGVPGAPAAGSRPPDARGGGPLVDLNIADQAELETLPEVGPVTARRSSPGGRSTAGSARSTSCSRSTASAR